MIDADEISIDDLPHNANWLSNEDGDGNLLTDTPFQDLPSVMAEVRDAITQEQSKKEKLIFALLHPSKGLGHRIGKGHVGDPIGKQFEKATTDATRARHVDFHAPDHEAFPIRHHREVGSILIESAPTGDNAEKIKQSDKDTAAFVHEAWKAAGTGPEIDKRRARAAKVYKTNIQALNPIRKEVRQANAQKIADKINELHPEPHTRVTAKDVFRYQQAWSASVEVMQSIALQEASVERFGLTPPAGYDTRKAVLEGGFFRTQLGEMYKKQADLIVEAQYEITQDWYRERGITHVTLHRGVRYDEDETTSEPPIPTWAKELYSRDRNGTADVQAELYPLSSWATDRSAASAFAGGGRDDVTGVILSTRVPVARIFSNSITGHGAMVESEHVLIGGHGTVSAFILPTAVEARAAKEAQWASKVAEEIQKGTGEKVVNLWLKDPELKKKMWKLTTLTGMTINELGQLTPAGVDTLLNLGATVTQSVGTVSPDEALVNADWIHTETPPSLKDVRADVRGAIEQSQTKKEKKIFALLHPSEGIGHRIGKGFVGHPIGSPEHQALVDSFIQKMTGFEELPNHQETHAFLESGHTDWTNPLLRVEAFLSPAFRLDVYQEDMKAWPPAEGHFRAIAEARGEPYSAPLPPRHSPEYDALVKGFRTKLANDEAPSYRETKAHFERAHERPYDSDHPTQPPQELTGNVSMQDIRNLHQNLTGDTSGFFQAIEEQRARLAGISVEDARQIEDYEQIHHDRRQVALAHPAELGKVESVDPFTDQGAVIGKLADGLVEPRRAYVAEGLARGLGYAKPTVVPPGATADPHALKSVRLAVRNQNADLITNAINAQSHENLGFTRNDAYKFQDDWSASVQNPYSIALQQAVMEKFGVPEPQGWSTRIEGTVPEHPTVFSGHDAMAYPRILAKARLFVDAQHELTQQHFKEQGITHVTLFRGVQHVNGYNQNTGHAEEPPEWFMQITDDGAPMEVEPFPLSSWALDPDVAQRFSESEVDGESLGAIFVSRVPVERILANGITGIGAMTESEHVMIGGPTQSFVFRSAGDWTGESEEASYNALKDTVSNYLGDHPGESYDSLLSEDPGKVFVKLTLYNPHHDFEEDDVHDYINQYGPED